MTKLVLIASLLVGTTLSAVQPLAAQDCVREYEMCLNDTYDTEGITRIMADIECFARYVGCIRRAL